MKNRADHPLLGTGGKKRRKKKTDMLKDIGETDSLDVYLKSVSLSSP